MKRGKLFKIIIVIFAIIFLVAAFNIGKIYYDYHQADSFNNEIQKEYISNSEEPPSSDQTDKVEQTTPPIPPITIDFDSLLARNSDVIGWLYCENTVINYPVVQGEDNNQYLKQDIDGNYLVSGTLFADYRNNELLEGPNYIIYGHHMKNGTMFGSIAKYKSQDYYDQHPVMYYLTPNTNYKLELFAGLVIKHNDKIYNPNQTKEQFSSLLEEYQAKSTFKSNVQLTDGDTIVTLSTCSYEFDNARYIVIGRLIAI